MPRSGAQTPWDTCLRSGRRTTQATSSASHTRPSTKPSTSEPRTRVYRYAQVCPDEPRLTRQWYDLKQKDVRARPEFGSRPSERKNRFFDSLGPGGVQTPKPSATDTRSKDAAGGQELQIDSQDIYQFAHYGYVNCMMLGTGILPEAPSEELLVSGGGDGRILLWNINPEKAGAITRAHVLEDGREEGASILSLALEGNFLYSGRFDGEVNIWDLQTRQLVRSLKANIGDVSTLTLGGGALFAGGKSGRVQVCAQTSFVFA